MWIRTIVSTDGCDHKEKRKKKGMQLIYVTSSKILTRVSYSSNFFFHLRNKQLRNGDLKEKNSPCFSDVI